MSFISKEPEEEMAESAIDSSEHLSEETEEPDPLQPDDGGERVPNILAFLTPLVPMRTCPS